MIKLTAIILFTLITCVYSCNILEQKQCLSSGKCAWCNSTCISYDPCQNYHCAIIISSYRICHYKVATAATIIIAIMCVCACILFIAININIAMKYIYQKYRVLYNDEYFEL